MNQAVLDLLKTKSGDELRYAVWGMLAGNINTRNRQEAVRLLTGTKMPVAKCGVSMIIDLIEKSK